MASTGTRGNSSRERWRALGRARRGHGRDTLLRQGGRRQASEIVRAGLSELSCADPPRGGDRIDVNSFLCGRARLGDSCVPCVCTVCMGHGSVAWASLGSRIREVPGVGVHTNDKEISSGGNAPRIDGSGPCLTRYA